MKKNAFGERGVQVCGGGQNPKRTDGSGVGSKIPKVRRTELMNGKTVAPGPKDISISLIDQISKSLGVVSRGTKWKSSSWWIFIVALSKL
jgi:hypothetical protein